MATIEPLRVQHKVDCKDRPLAVVANLPGVLAELSPAQLRALAAALTTAAAECEALQQETRAFGPARREYRVAAA